MKKYTVFKSKAEGGDLDQFSPLNHHHGAQFPPIDVNEPVFGRSLSQVLATESAFYSDGAKVPTILRQCVESLYRSTWKYKLGLFTDGIFRESGNNLKVKMYKELCDNKQLTTISLNNSIDNPFSISNAHNVASLLKQYLRELPEPIMGFGAYDPVVNSLRNMTTEHTNQITLKVIKELMRSDMNYENVVVVNVVLFLLHECSLVNDKMTAANLGIVFGQCFFKEPPKELTKREASDAATKMREAVFTNTAVQIMIENYHSLFTGQEPYLFKVYYPYYGDLRCPLPIDEDEEYIEQLNELYQVEMEFKEEILPRSSTLPPYTRMLTDLESDFELPLENDEITEFVLDSDSVESPLYITASNQSNAQLDEDSHSDNDGTFSPKQTKPPVLSPRPQNRVRSNGMASPRHNTKIFTPSVECVNSTMNEFNNLISEFNHDPVMKDRLESIYAKIFHSVYAVSNDHNPVITPYSVMLNESNKEIDYLRNRRDSCKRVLEEFILEL